MEYSTLITTRRSVRSYQPDKSVPHEVLLRIVEAGRVAPSAANRQPWKFLVISDATAQAALSESYQKEWFKNAPHVLVVVGQQSAAWQRNDGYNAIETDATIAMDHMILAATNEGVGTCWIAAFDYPLVRSALQLAEGEIVFAITPLGYPQKDWAPSAKTTRKTIEEIVEFR